MGGLICPGAPGETRTPSVVLTSGGLSGIVELVKNGRKVYQRFWSSRPSRLLLTIMALDILAGALISTFGIHGLFPALPIAMTLFLLGWNFALSLILNDYVKAFFLTKSKLGVRAPGTTPEGWATRPSRNCRAGRQNCRIIVGPIIITNCK